MEQSKKARKDLLVMVGVVLAAVAAIWLFNRGSDPDPGPEAPPASAQIELLPIEHDLPGPYEGTPRREAPEFTPVEVLAPIPSNPTDQQIAGSRLFGLRLMATDETGENENRAVGGLLRELRGLDAQIAKKIDRASDPHGFERAYRKEKFARVGSWLGSNPDSPWAAALRHELAGYRYDRGYLEEARTAWEQNWTALKESPAGSDGYQLANEALGKLLDLTRGYARVEQLRELVAAGQDRRWGSALKGKLFHADRSLWLLEHRGAQNIMCGPLALNCINHKLGKPVTPPMLGKVSQEYIGIGLPLTEVARYAGENYRVEARMARRENNDAAIPVPAVVHDKDEHYFAVLESSESGDEYFIEDRTRDYAGWIDREALEARSSGYFLLAGNERIEQLPAGWSAVDEEEGRQIFGRDKDHNTEECNTECCPSGDCNGMPRYSIHRLPAILRLNDVPLGYRPPVGYGVNFYLSHLDIDSGSPGSSPPFSNVGFTWSVRWIAWVDHQPGALDANSVIKVHVPGGGLIRHRYDANNQPVREPQSGTVLTRSGYTYTRTAMDGSKEVYGVADNPSAPDRVFLSQLIDPNGNTLSFGYDAQMRLVTVTDAIGQVTTLQYNHPSDIYKITSVSDPFNRTAVLDYDPADGDKLAKITDQIGLETTFVWNSNDDVESMTTPYGTTQFETFGHTNTGSGAGTAVTWVKVTDPQGDVEKVEYVDRGFANVAAINPPPASVTVAGQTIPIFTDEASLGSRATFVWDKEAWHSAPDDHSAATMLQWYTDTDWKVVPVLQARKEANEDVVWYDYPGTGAVDDSTVMATSNLDTSQGIQPTRILRVRSDGTGVLTRIEYNAQGRTKKVIDPLGRSTEFTYSADGLDQLSVRQTTGGINETLVSVSYNAAHQPTSVTDAAGQTWSIGYNARGQVQTMTNPRSETTTNTYDANGYLQSANGPLPGNADVTSYGYDAMGRPDSITRPGGHTVSVTYDAFDRVTRVDYPDNTFTASSYDKLNLKTSRDRLGRTTTYGHNALGQVAWVSDPLGRSTVVEWCRCGDIRKLTDAMGRVTEWQRDVQGRPVQKSYPDGSTESWTYDPSLGYLTGETRRNGQGITYAYTLGGRLASVAYPQVAGIPAPAGVSYSYDAVYGRLATMSDGIGSTAYSYRAAGSLGAGKLATVDGPWANDTVTYTYDNLGQVADHTINGVSFGTNRIYDSLGRLTSITNALGTFAYTHDSSSHLGLTSVGYPNGMAVDYDYQDASNDFRLASIHNRNQGGGTASRFTYGYDAAGQITGWTRELSTGTSSYAFGYDAAGQLTSSILTPAGQPAGATRHHTYSAAGNRTAEGLVGDESTALFNNLNQMTQSTPQPSSLRTLVAGQLDEPAEVKIDGQPVPITSDNRFERNMNLLPGTYQIPVEATDRDGNTSTKNYEITVAEPVPQLMQYDSTGNLVRQVREDGKARIFEWDGLGRLMAIQSDETPAADDWRAEFSYDGKGRRVGRTEFTHDGSGWEQDESVSYLWCGTQLCQERDASGAGVNDHYLPQGFMRGASKYFTTRDHLGSVREVVSEGGVLYAAFDYDPWGRAERLYGNPAFAVPFRYTGHFHHERSELHMTLFRAYDPALGRWLSPDPIGENGGLNLYGYVVNNPISLLDPLGLDGNFYSLFHPVNGTNFAGDLMAVANSPEYGNHGKWFVLGGHSNGKCIWDEREETETNPAIEMSPAAVADFIFTHDQYKPGMPVYLFGCGTGSIAQEVAKELAKKNNGRRTFVRGNKGSFCRKNGYIPRARVETSDQPFERGKKTPPLYDSPTQWYDQNGKVNLKDAPLVSSTP